MTAQTTGTIRTDLIDEGHDTDRVDAAISSLVDVGLTHDEPIDGRDYQLTDDEVETLRDELATPVEPGYEIVTYDLDR